MIKHLVTLGRKTLALGWEDNVGLFYNIGTYPKYSAGAPRFRILGCPPEMDMGSGGKGRGREGIWVQPSAISIPLMFFVGYLPNNM